MEDSVRLNVLWVDDIPTEEFMNEAYEYGLAVKAARSVEEGLSMLKDKSVVWDAIILDANCKITPNAQEQPSLKALQKAIHELVTMRTEVPWFVYTGGDYEGVEHLNYMISERGYDNRIYYEKPAQRYVLFESIKHAVAEGEAFLVRQKYATVCNFYDGYDLVNLLIRYDKDGFDTDKSVPHDVRLILEWIMRYFESVGLLPIAFTGTNIAQCSAALAEIPQIVPIHVARSMHFCTQVSNNGSHGDEIIANIVGGEAPYLNKSIIMNLLNILHWCPSLQRYEKDELKKKVAQYQKETREKKDERNRNFKNNR